MANNPYLLLAEQHYQGMAYIESQLTLYMFEANLFQLVYDYVQPIYYPAPEQVTINELKSIPPNARDAYSKGTLSGNLLNWNGYDSQQGIYIKELIRLSHTPVGSLETFMSEWLDGISKSGMSFQQQAPLLFAADIGRSNYLYWMTEIDNPASKWYTCGYFNAEMYANRAAVPKWVLACIQATLWGANKAKIYGMIDPPRIIGIDLVSALTASLTVAAGKVMFGWPFDKPSNVTEELRQVAGLELREDGGIELRE